jgi:phospholipid/cholesterol/gamma-HCH transport system substrate-binding protein
MVTRSQKIRLGIFITVAFVVILIAIGTLSFDVIFDTKDVYYVAYEDVSVSGLDVGSSVKYLGLNVGTVRNIEIDAQNINKIIVTIAVDPGTPIKDDVRAEIATIGITGLKQIELRGGTVESAMLAPGGFIQPGKSLTEDITGRAEVITEKIELVLNNLLEMTSVQNQERIFAFVDESAETVAKVNALVDRNSEHISRTIANMDSLTAELKSVSIAARHAAVTLEGFLSSDTLSTVLADLSDITGTLKGVDLAQLVSDVNMMVLSLNTVLGQTEALVSRNSGKLMDTIDELHLTTRYLSSTARRIESNPSILLRGSRPDNPPDAKLER